MKRNNHSFRSRLTSALILCAMLMLVISSHLLASRATSQDPNATLPSPKKTPTPKTTTPPPKKRTPRNSRTSPAKSNSDSAAAAEMIFWNSIKDSTNPEDFKEYLKKYPDGEFAGLAANRLKTLEGAKSSTNPNSTNSSLSNLPHTRTNQVGIEFVLIPSGSFMMGGPGEKPVHQVTISQPFYMGKYEVTQGQWQRVMGTTLGQQRDKRSPGKSTVGEGDNYPMYYVSWEDAKSFLQRLNALNDGNLYRLPSEAEWEYACRAGTTGDYAGDPDSMAWYANNSGDGYIDADAILKNDENNYGTRVLKNGDRTHQVGTKQANGFG